MLSLKMKMQKVRAGQREPAIDRFWRYVQKSESGCWLWTGKRGSKGYGSFCVWKDGRWRFTNASRAAWFLLIGDVPDALLVCHHCDNPLCVNPAHLFLGTQTDNMQDAARKGRRVFRTGKQLRGTQHPRAALDESAVAQVHEIRSDGASIRMLAAQFGVSRSTIHRVLVGRN